MRDGDGTRKSTRSECRDEAAKRAAWERPELSKQSIVAITQKDGPPQDAFHGAFDPVS